MDYHTLRTPLRMILIQRYRHFFYIINEKQPTFKYAIEGRLFFLAQKFVLSIIIRIFAASVPTKPLNDAQMRGAFFFYNSSMLKYMAQVSLESAIFDIGITFYTAKIMFLYKP